MNNYKKRFVFDIIEETIDNNTRIKKRIFFFIILVLFLMNIIFFKTKEIRIFLVIFLLISFVFYRLYFVLNNYYSIIGFLGFAKEGILINNKLIKFNIIKRIIFYYDGFQSTLNAGVFTDTIYGNKTSRGIDNFIVIKTNEKNEVFRILIKNKKHFLFLKKQLTKTPIDISILKTPIPFDKVYD